MLALQTNCRHPATKQPYLAAAVGGRNNSPEGKSVGWPRPTRPGRARDVYITKRGGGGWFGSQNGFEHAFISQFANEADRRYYLESDLAHLAFVKSLEDLVDDAQVIDFTSGVF